MKVLRSTQKIGHFGDVLTSQSLSSVLKKLNLTQQMYTCTDTQKDTVDTVTVTQSVIN